MTSLQLSVILGTIGLWMIVGVLSTTWKGHWWTEFTIGVVAIVVYLFIIASLLNGAWLW